VGESLVFSNQQKSSLPSDPFDTAMVNFLGFSLVPEPSVIGLAVIATVRYACYDIAERANI
jgi:hypothetical protein